MPAIRLFQTWDVGVCCFDLLIDFKEFIVCQFGGNYVSGILLVVGTCKSTVNHNLLVLLSILTNLKNNKNET